MHWFEISLHLYCTFLTNLLDFDLFLYIFISKMHILIIYKQYEVMKTALPIVYIQFLKH